MLNRLGLVAALLLFPALALVTGALALLPLMMLPAAILGPAIFTRQRDPDGPEDSEDEGGDGGSPRPPDVPPRTPLGDLPLPDSRPGRWRSRGGERPGLREGERPGLREGDRPARRRIPRREPAHAPQRPRVPA